MTKPSLITLSALALAALQSTAVLADIPPPPAGWWADYKTFHGSECQPMTGAQSADFNYVGFGSPGGITNVSAGARYIVCPIVRDDIDFPNTFAVSVFVNSPAGQNAACWLQSRNQFGVLAAQAAGAAAGPAATILFGWGAVAKVADGNYNLVCLLQSGANLASYELGEAWNNGNIRTDYNN